MVSLGDAVMVGFGTLSTILAFLISYQAYRAYRFTGRRYLLNFTAGFFLFGVAYYLIGLVLSGFGALAPGSHLAWPGLILQSVSFLLLASSYLSRKLGGEEVSLVSLLLVLVVSVPLLSLFNPLPSSSFDEYFFLLNCLLAGHVLWQAAATYRASHLRASAFVASGFASFAASQFSWFLWALSDTPTPLFFALVLRLLALALIVQSLVELNKNHG